MREIRLVFVGNSEDSDIYVKQADVSDFELLEACDVLITETANQLKVTKESILSGFLAILKEVAK